MLTYSSLATKTEALKHHEQEPVQPMLKQVIEAQSSESMAEALALAMAEASIFLTEANDIRVCLLNRNSSRDGDYNATLEITLIPYGGIETPTSSLDNAESPSWAETMDRERKVEEAASVKARVIEQVQRRKSGIVFTSSMDRPQLTEIALASQLEKENTVKALNDDGSPHERVDDSIHQTAVNILVEREFAHVTDSTEDVVIKLLPLPEGPATGPSMPRKKHSPKENGK